MLRLIGPADSPPPPAYPVPWLIEPGPQPGVLRAVNASPDDLERVIVTLLSSGELLLPHAARVRPGEALRIDFPRGAPIASSVALIAWRVHGLEYLYRVAR